MATELYPEIAERFTEVGDHRIRYLECGSGHAVILLHGGSLGSSADVFRRNMGPLCDAGFRAIAPDMPGFGGSSYSDDGSLGLKKKVILGLMDNLGIETAAIIGHSQAGNTAVRAALDHPEKFTHVVVLGTGSLLPPLETGTGKREEAARERMDRRMSQSEPTLADTRKLLEATLYHHDLITDEELAMRHSWSTGDCFRAHVARTEATAAARAAKKSAGGPTPEKRAAWESLDQLQQPLLMMYGVEDRGRAADRAALLQSLRPGINLHMAEHCKHLMPWDAEARIRELVIPFLKNQRLPEK